MEENCFHDYLDGCGFRPLASRVVKNILLAAHNTENLDALCCSTEFLEWPRWEELKSEFEKIPSGISKKRKT